MSCSVELSMKKNYNLGPWVLLCILFICFTRRCKFYLLDSWDNSTQEQVTQNKENVSYRFPEFEFFMAAH